MWGHGFAGDPSDRLELFKLRDRLGRLEDELREQDQALRAARKELAHLRKLCWDIFNCLVATGSCSDDFRDVAAYWAFGENQDEMPEVRAITKAMAKHAGMESVE